MHLRSQARQTSLAPSSPQGTTAKANASLSASIDTQQHRAGTARTTRKQARQWQGTPGRLLLLPSELLEHILSQVDKDSWAGLYRTCKQLRDWVASQAAADWSSKVETRLYLWNSIKWWERECVKPSDWQWMSHPQTPHFVMLQKQPAQNLVNPPLLMLPQQLELPAFIQNGETDVDRLKSIVSTAVSQQFELQLHITSPQWLENIMQPLPPVYAHSWLAFFLNPQQALPSVAACFTHITIIRLQNVRLVHPLPDCIGTMCTSLRKYVLQDVVWPEQLQPGKPWPQLQHLAISTTSTAQLPQLINPTTLPSLKGLYITSWPFGVAASLAVALCRAFSKQLSSLVLGYQESLSATFSGCSLEPAFPHVMDVQLQYSMQDKDLRCLLAAAPALQHLKVQKLQLSRSQAKVRCKLLCLEIDDMPQFVATLARLPSMPDLKQLSLPAYRVQVQNTNRQQAAAATAVVNTLQAVPHFITLDFKGTTAAAVQHMQTLGPLLRALQQKSAQATVYYEALDETKLRALGAAALPRCAFQTCYFWPPSLVQHVWTLMPHTQEVQYSTIEYPNQPLRVVYETLALCRSAMRPVTVDISWLTSEQKQQIQSALAADGIQHATVKCRW